MEEVFCDISAFHFYRTPPSVLALFDELPISRDQLTRQTLSGLPFAEHVLGTPLNVIVTSRCTRSSASKTIKRHLWLGELPSEAVREIEGSGTFTSPEMTLLLMARWMSVPRLALAMYEFCGSFTVYKPTPELEIQVKQSGSERLNHLAGWQRVIDSKGAPTTLWKRPPLLSCERLHEFAAENAGVYGGKIFRQATDMVAGMTRSPLEAEAALLFYMSRRLGGYGLKIKTNKVIRLTARARKIYQHDYCEADIYIESPDGSRIVDVECQGAAVHTGERALVSDANRTTALESMGIAVVQITYQDVRNMERMAIVVEHIADKLGVNLAPKTERMLRAERKLREELPLNWLELAEAETSQRTPRVGKRLSRKGATVA